MPCTNGLGIDALGLIRVRILAVDPVFAVFLLLLLEAHFAFFAFLPAAAHLFSLFTRAAGLTVNVIVCLSDNSMTSRNRWLLALFLFGGIALTTVPAGTYGTRTVV